ncbi:hypothetical protein L7F22_035296 [Adiantum nelumboides]|nr:hypothetical protein [Adiantum nelumboides]
MLSKFFVVVCKQATGVCKVTSDIVQNPIFKSMQNAILATMRKSIAVGACKKRKKSSVIGVSWRRKSYVMWTLVSSTIEADECVLPSISCYTFLLGVAWSCTSFRGACLFVGVMSWDNTSSEFSWLLKFLPYIDCVGWITLINSLFKLFVYLRSVLARTIKLTYCIINLNTFSLQ